MEVKVVEAEGIANDNILMIRAGPMRRQAKLNAGLPFQFPSLPLNANPFKVEVFQPLGSKSLILSPDAEVYSVNLPATEFAPSSKIQLEIKDMPVGGTEGINNTVEPPAPQEEVIEDGSKNDDQITTKKAQNEESLRRVEKAKAEAALAAKGYLNKHNLVNFVQEMLTTVLKEKPFDPYCYMRDYARGQLAPKQPDPPAAVDEEADNFGEDEDSTRAIDGKTMPAQDMLSGHRVPLKLTLEGVDYQKLLSDSALTSQVVAVIRTQIAAKAGVDEKIVSMELSAGSLKVDAVLSTPDLKMAQSAQQQLDANKETLRKDTTQAVKDLIGISNASDGAIECSAVEVGLIQGDVNVNEDLGEDNTKWYQQSQRAMVLDGESAMLTISEDTVNSRIRFDVFIPAKNPPYRWVVCSLAEFDSRCADAKGTTEADKMMDAITRLFTEDLEENRPPVDSFESTPEPRAVSASVSPESEIAHQLAQWATDGCAQEAVSQEEEKAVAEDEVLEQQPPAASQPQEQSRDLPAEFTSRELPLGLGMEEATTTASAPPMEAKPPDKPKPENPRPNGNSLKAKGQSAIAEEQAKPVYKSWNYKPSVGSWAAPVLPTAIARAKVEQEERNQAAAPKAPAVQSEVDLRADNERLVGKNEALRAEIARLKARLGDDGAAPAPAPAAAPAPQPAPAPAPQAAAPVAQAATSADEVAAVAAAKKVLSEEASKQPGTSLDALVFDDVFDKCVGELYQEHKKKNEELRASYARLSSENVQLVQEQERMKQMLLRLCYGLEGMATDIRAAVGEPTFKPPMKSKNLELENKDLRQNIVAMYEANRKLRSDNQALSSELSSRGVSRAGTQMSNPTPFPAASFAPS